jgi:simple sugar transport system permease protein
VKGSVSQWLAAQEGNFVDLVVAALATLAALIVGGVLIALSGISPIRAYQTMFDNIFGTKNGWGEVLLKMTPLLLAGLGAAFAFQARIFNIGIEGQIYTGALVASIVGLFLGNLPIVIGIPLLLLAGFLGGGLWAGLAGLLKVRFKANEIIVTLMMNYIALELTSYLLNGPWRDPKGTESYTARFIEGVILPVVLPGTRLHAGIFVALLAAGAMWWLLRRTVLGYRVTLTGASESAATYSGLKIHRIVLIALFISGGLAGVAGACEASGIHHRMLLGLSPDYGYTAIAVAMLGRQNPLGVIVAAFVFAALEVGISAMQDFTGVPVSLVFIIEGLVLLFILGSRFLRRKAVSA